MGSSIQSADEKKNTTTLTSIRGSNGTCTITAKDTSAALLKNFFPDDDPEDDTETQYAKRLKARDMKGGPDDRLPTRKGIDLLRSTETNRVDLCFIQEPNVRRHKVTGLGENRRLLYDTKGQPRCAILIVNPIVTACFLEDLSSEIMIGENNFFAIYAYVPPRESKCIQFAEVMEQMERAIVQLKKRDEVLLCAGANCKYISLTCFY